jgi:hypothetical protein
MFAAAHPHIDLTRWKTIIEEFLSIAHIWYRKLNKTLSVKQFNQKNYLFRSVYVDIQLVTNGNL